MGAKGSSNLMKLPNITKYNIDDNNKPNEFHDTINLSAVENSTVPGRDGKDIILKYKFETFIVYMGEGRYVFEYQRKNGPVEICSAEQIKAFFEWLETEEGMLLLGSLGYTTFVPW